jgi:hypothetical protein
VNIAAAGSVTVNGEAPDNTKDYPANTTLTLVATANNNYVFDRWSDGVTTASRTVVTKGMPEALTAIFKTA